MRVRQPAPGQPVVWDMELPTGDYELMLSSGSDSIQPYALSLERADPYILPADLEPNGTQDAARDLPPTMTLDGTGWGTGGEDDDWYRLPVPPDAAMPIVVATTTGVTRLEMSDGEHSVAMDRADDTVTWTSRTLPAGVPLYLHVTSSGDYHLAVSGGGYVAEQPPAALPMTLSLATMTTDVAAYEDFGQRVGGTLTLRDTGAQPLTLALDGRTSDDRWGVELGQATVVVPPGGSVDVPISIGVPADAWADMPTRVTLRAVASDGRVITAATEITPGRDAAPVGAEQAWPVPQGLLGGLDAASLALGATVKPVGNPESEAAAARWVAVAGAGYTGSIGGEPDDVHGRAGHGPAGPGPGPDRRPARRHAGLRRIAACLRPVAVHGWQRLPGGPVGRAEPAPGRPGLRAGRARSWRATRSCASGPPGAATAAASSSASGRSSPRQAGRPPGRSISPHRPTVATSCSRSPARATRARATAMLTDEPGAEPVGGHTWSRTSTMSWVVGFREGRAAQVTELQWVDPANSDPSQRFDALDVAGQHRYAAGPMAGRRHLAAVTSRGWERVAVQARRAHLGTLHPVHGGRADRPARATGRHPPRCGSWSGRRTHISLHPRRLGPRGTAGDRGAAPAARPVGGHRVGTR